MAVVKVEKNSYTVDPLYQWDLNRTLEIYGLSMAAAPEIHFTNEAMVRALRCFTEMDAAGVIRVGVPNSLLQKPYKIKAIVCIREGDVFKSYREIVIPVKARPQPADYTITGDDEIYSFIALENLVYDSVASMEKKNAEAAANATEALNTANAAKQTADAAASTANGIAGTAQAAMTAASAAQAAVGGKATVTRTTATLTAEGWTGDAAPYTQALTVDGILETDTPHVAPVYSADLSTKLAEKEAWAMVCEAEAEAGVMTFACFEEKPGVPINIQIEVVR